MTNLITPSEVNSTILMSIPTKQIPYKKFSDKQIGYLKDCLKYEKNCAEGAIRSGKTILNCLAAYFYLQYCEDKIHLATGSTIANAKMNIGVCNGFGLEYLFHDHCRWGKFRNNEALFIQTKTGEKIVVFAGGGKADSYKSILGFSIGLWIATEINLHYDSDDSETSFIKVAMGRQIAAKQPKLLWDLNPSSPNHKIYKDYIDKWREEGLLHWEHFTIRDNLAISEERRRQIEKQYDPNSVWYRRDIQGMRCVAEGLIYQSFADQPRKRMITKQEFELIRPSIIKIECGVDFGGNISKHTFVANAYTTFYKDKICLKSVRIKDECNPDQLNKLFVNFCNEIYNKYSRGFDTKFDNAEPVLARGLSSAAIQNHCHTELKPAFKLPILQRIRTTETLLSQNRIWYLEGQCETYVEAMCNAQWNPKKPDERLDNGTSDIDTLDADEYSFEGHIKDLMAQSESLVAKILKKE